MKATTTTPKAKAPKTISIKGVVKSKKATIKETTPTPEQKPLTDKQIFIRQRRQELKELSKKLQLQALEHGLKTSTNFLLRQWYASDGHKELKTFEQWKEQGFSVRKGEKALLLWQNESEESTEFYPLAFLFSQQQVTQYAQQ